MYAAQERAGTLAEDPYRRGHRIKILSHAAAPLKRELGKKRFDRLVRALSVIYGIVLTLQVLLFVRWQKRPAFEPADEAVSDDAGTSAGGPLARLRRRREARTSAYGRPVTTTAGE